MNFICSKNITDLEKRDHLSNSFGSAWPAVISTLLLIYLDFSSQQIFTSNIVLTSFIFGLSLIQDLKSKIEISTKLKINLNTRYYINLLTRLVIYLCISLIVSNHIMFFPLLSWQSILCCGIFIGSAERLIYQNYFNPNYARFVLIAFQLPVIAAGFSLESSNARLLAVVIILQCLIHLKKISSFYNIYKTKNELQERIEDERKELHTLLDLLPVGVAKIKNDMTYLHANKYITTTSKNPLNSILGKKMGFSGKDDFNHQPIIDFIQSTDIHFEIVMNFYNAEDEKNRRHQTYWQKISHVEVIIVSVDIEDLLQTKENLQKEREFTLSVLNAVPDPIFVKNTNLNWIYGNNSFSNLINHPPYEYLLKSESNFIDGILATELKSKDEYVLKNFCSDESEEVFNFDQERQLTFLTKRTPYQLTSGETILVGVMRDITDRRRLELDLLEKSKFASLGQMAAGVAHEINNPLAIIEGRAELLSRQIKSNEPVSNEKILADLLKITQTTGRIAKIIKSMRVLAHSNEKIILELTDLDTLVNNSLGICFEKFKVSGVLIEINLLEGIKVNVDLTQMGQVLVNLAMNSFDAVIELPKPQRWVQVTSQIYTKNSQFIDIFVTDGGDGIPSEIREKIMNPFFTTKKVGKGTGLGLSVSKTIVISNGGTITLDSQSKNTCFVITLPIA